MTPLPGRLLVPVPPLFSVVHAVLIARTKTNFQFLPKVPTEETHRELTHPCQGVVASCRVSSKETRPFF